MINRKMLLFGAGTVFSILSCTQRSSEPKNRIIGKDTQPVNEVKKPNSVLKNAAFDAIEGLYIQKPYEEGGENCNLSVKIKKEKGKYYYTLSLQDTVINGKVTVAKNNDKGDLEYAVTLEGIEWASYEGDVSDESKPSKELDIPVGIETVLSNKELVFQNYGNSMNSYTVLEGCGQKYIRLVKQ
jgi:hypothetical protein